MTTVPPVRRWTATAAHRAITGTAASGTAAWAAVVDAAIALTTEISETSETTAGPDAALVLAVDQDTAEVLPARTVTGAVDVAATRAMLQRFLDSEPEVDEPTTTRDPR